MHQSAIHTQFRVSAPGASAAALVVAEEAVRRLLDQEGVSAAELAGAERRRLLAAVGLAEAPEGDVRLVGLFAEARRLAARLAGVDAADLALPEGAATPPLSLSASW